MKIGVNARLLVSPKMEGIARYIYETTVHMALTHPDDEFILFFDRQYNGKFIFPSNIKCVVVPWHARHSYIWYLWFEIMLPMYFKIYKIDVFYSGEGYLSKKSRVPTLLVLHDLTYLHYPEHVQKDSLMYFRKNTPKFLEIAQTVVTVSHYVKGDIIRHFAITPEKIKVAYNAVTPIQPQKHTKLPPILEPYFIYVGAIHPRKNVKNIIEAFLQFKISQKTNIKLVLLGRMAWDTKEIEQMVNFSEDIIYLGMLDDDSKNVWIRNAVCMVYVSLFEGFGIPILEAMNLGTPVITSNITSMPEVASDAAICVDPTSINEIAEAMNTILKDNTLRDTLIEKGHKRVKDFQWSKSAQIIYSELFKIVKPNLENT